MGLLNTVQHFQYGITYVYAMDVYRTSMGLHNNVYLVKFVIYLPAIIFFPL